MICAKYYRRGNLLSHSSTRQVLSDLYPALLLLDFLVLRVFSKLYPDL